jgi:hypothetical protein
MISSADTRNRRWRQPLNQQLPAAARWVAGLPSDFQPRALLQRFPRIANDLARVWQDDTELQLQLDDLLTDRRGGRQGFPPEIHQELSMLREYCNRRRRNASEVPDSK